MNQETRNKQVITGLVVLVIIAAIVVGVTALAPKDSASPSTAPTTSTQLGESSATTRYQDGSYTATGSYSSPGGTEKITVSVTLKDNLITDTSAQSGAIDSEGREYQSQFIAGYKGLIVGKNISSVSLSRVSGSSLTSQGFNSALNQIKSQAKG